MGFLKEILEAAKVILDKARPIAEWASVSFWRSLSLVSVVLVCALGAVVIYSQGLLSIVEEDVDSRGQQMRFATEELQYKATLDSIELCINATKNKLDLRAWYCQHATMMFEQASQHWPRERAADIVAKHAYGAMKIDVQHYLRSVDLSRLTHMPPTREKRQLDFLVSKAGSGIIMFGLLSLLFLGMYYLRRTPPRTT